MGHNDDVWGIAFSPDGRRIASACSRFDRKSLGGASGSGKESVTLRGHTSGVTSLAFAPDGRRIASASSDRTVKVWNPDLEQEALTLRGHSASVHSVAFQP